MSTEPLETYGGVHARLAREKGPAASFDCVVCANPADEWAYVGTHGGILPFGPPDDYVPMCRRHHREHDAATRKQRRAHGPEQDFLF